MREAARSMGVREEIRTLSVSQPTAGAPFNMLPTLQRFKSDAFTVMLERRLGLPIAALRNIAGQATLRGTTVDAKGDACCNISGDHSFRHNQVSKQWARALRRAYPGSHRFGSKTGVEVEWPRHQRFSPGARPDVVVFDAMGQDVHLLCEVKVRSPITAGSRSQRALGASVAFGNTEPGDRTAVLLGPRTSRRSTKAHSTGDTL